MIAQVMPLLTASRLSAARRCLRLHKLKYVDGYRAVSSADTLRFGSLVHLGLEAWWRAPAGQRLGPALDALRASAESDPFDLVKAEVMLIGYDARWGAEEYEVLAVERKFRGPVRNPDTGSESRIWQLGGKVDAIVRDQAGRVLVVEHKTSSEDIQQGSEYWRRLRMDGQVSTYFEGARVLGYDVQGCLYDVLGKPRQIPFKATPPEARKLTKTGALYANQREHDETPGEYRERIARSVAENPGAYFQRAEVARLEAELDEALRDTWFDGQRLREDIRLGRAPRNPGACSQYGRTCEFFDVCTGTASLDDPLRFTRSDDVHPELAGPASEAPKEEATAP